MKRMKGDVSPVVYIVAAVIIIVIVLGIFLVTGGQFGSTVTKTECQGKIQVACNNIFFRNIDPLEALRDVPAGCKVYFNELEGCGGNMQICRSLCEKVGLLVQ
ncbi:MAG: hypothetical protein QXW01_01255 [Candidatus Aenigmatarchaeota archaeon]